MLKAEEIPGTGSGPTTSQPPDVTGARDRLLRAAAELFSRKGYASTSVGEIVAAAGVTKPVLYYHFESKSGLYLHLMADGLAILRETIGAACRERSGSARDRIASLCEAVTGLAIGNLSIVRLTRRSSCEALEGAPAFDVSEFHRTVREALDGLLEEGLRSGEFLPVPREHLAWAVLGLLSAFIDSNLGEPALALTPQGFRASLDLVLAGVTAARRHPEGDR